MTAIFYLIPISIVLALAALAGFFWTVGSGQYDDPEGDRSRILEPEDFPLIRFKWVAKPDQNSATDSKK